MIREAVDDDADWIIFDDCDCVPNDSLRESARSFLESDGAHSCVMALRIYLWGRDKYFPKLNEPGPSLWAWRPAVRNIRADESNPWEHRMLGIPRMPRGPLCDNLSFPMVLLHYSWPTPEAAAKKVEKYRASGQHPNAVAPTEFAGPMAPILPFMTTSLH
jgi:hypothetical protein